MQCCILISLKSFSKAFHSPEQGTYTGFGVRVSNHDLILISFSFSFFRLVMVFRKRRDLTPNRFGYASASEDNKNLNRNPTTSSNQR